MSIQDTEVQAKPRGRPRMQAHESVEQALGMETTDPRSPNKGVRPPRVRLTQGGKLDVAEHKLDDKNYRYYWFLDDPQKPGRIQAAIAAYWEHVTNSQGQAITRPAGANVHYLMRLPMEYALEDLELKREKVRATMDKEASLGVNEYAPDQKGRAEGGTSALTRHSSGNPYS
jgi:hypothetical protein